MVPTGALILGYVFLLKMMSFMQSRLGPMESGPGGSLQLVVDLPHQVGLGGSRDGDGDPHQDDRDEGHARQHPGA